MIARSWALLCRMVLLLAVAVALLAVTVALQRNPYVMLFVLAFCVWLRTGRRLGSGWSHGTARMGTLADLVKGRMLCDSGLITGNASQLDRPARLPAMLGLLNPLRRSDQACRAFLSALLGADWQADLLIRIDKFCHYAVFAKTGAGKGVSIIVPNLLSYLHAVVVTDLKGELWQLTAEHRRRRLRHKVFRLDPLGIAGPVAGSATLNPLDFIDETSDDFLDQCRELAGALAVKTGKEIEVHWVESARIVLTAFIAFVCGCESDRSKRNLHTVRQFVTSRVAFANAITVMQQQPDACEGVIARLGNMLTWYVDRELGSVLSTVQRFTEFLDSPSIQRNTASSSFDPRILRTGKVSLYLCLPHDKVDTLAPLQRMWISTTLRLLTQGKADEKNPVLFVLDEVAHLGRVEAIERAVTLLRGFGIRLFFAFQSIGQVREVYGDKADVILGNIGTQQYFSVNDYASAEAISNRIGETTISIQSVNRSTSRSRPTESVGPNSQPGTVSTTTSTNYSDIGRKLIRPEEIMTLDEDVSLLFHNNRPVVATKLIRYYDHPAFRRGGTGKPRRLGLEAGIAAVAVLAVSIGVLAAATSLPDPAAMKRMAAISSQRQAVPASLTPGYRQQRLLPSSSGARRPMPPRRVIRPQGSN